MIESKLINIYANGIRFAVSMPLNQFVFFKQLLDQGETKLQALEKSKEMYIKSNPEEAIEFYKDKIL